MGKKKELIKLIKTVDIKEIEIYREIKSIDIAGLEMPYVGHTGVIEIKIIGTT